MKMHPKKPAFASSVIAAFLGALCLDGRGAEEIIRGHDSFEFVYRARLPRIEGKGQLWLPLAKTNPWQTITVENISAPTEPRKLQDHDYGNLILIFSVEPADSDKTIEINYRVERNEKSSYSATESDTGRFLQPERLVPANQTFQKLAVEITRGKESTMERGRALYNHVASQMKYDKSGSGWGAGDAVHACQALAGNCTDFHAYFIALARAAGIPARFAIGASIPADKEEGTVAGYHCWAEFLADGNWVPVDISEAAKNPALAEYYFGHHPANRFELSAGRDLLLTPTPASGPINFLVYPLLEVDGKIVKADTEFVFRRMKKK